MSKEIFKLQRPVIQLGKQSPEDMTDVLAYNEERSIDVILPTPFSTIQILFNSNEMKTFWYGNVIDDPNAKGKFIIEFTGPAPWQEW